MIFETERLLVRQYNEKDGDHFFALNGDENVVRYIRPAKSREEADVFLSEVINYYRDFPLQGRWAVDEKESGKFIGSFALIPVEGKDQMQLGYALLPVAWGKGYATELTLAGVQYVFDNTQIDPIYAYAELPNIPSQKVLLKGGFSLDSQYVDGDKEMVGFVLSKENYLQHRNGK